jgi:pSer/pThr/pTyr-binding forkhead associated (FHA) protein
MVPGRSERLETKTSAEDAGPTKVILQVLEGDVGNNRKELRINTTTSIGRSSDHAQLVLQGNRDHSPISRLHCTILEKEDGFEVRDESSANGTFLNDIRLAPGKAQELKDGDLLELAKVRDGGVKLKFQAGSPPVYMKTRMVAPPSAEPEDKISPDGYTPTKPMN